MARFTNFSFGATSAIVTSLALIVGLDSSANPKLTIIGSLLLLAIADNISDSLGIHIYQESQLLSPNAIKVSTFTNFITRLLITLSFVLLVIFLPLGYAIIFSVVFGLLLLAIMSYFIAKYQKVNPYSAIFQHVGLAVLVIIMSHFLGNWIMGMFTRTSPA